MSLFFICNLMLFTALGGAIGILVWGIRSMSITKLFIERGEEVHMRILSFMAIRQVFLFAALGMVLGWCIIPRV